MARYPEAIWRELPENNTEPLITPRVLVYHSIVGSAEGAYRYFRDRSSLESHFIVPKNGEVWQLIDTGRQADANYKANPFAISVETEDNGDPDNDPWTPEQIESLINLGLWAKSAHAEIHNRLCDKWNGSGFGFHSQFPEWSPVTKSCPGKVRIKQFHELILPRLKTATYGSVDDMTPEQERRILDALGVNRTKIERTFNQVNIKTGLLPRIWSAVQRIEGRPAADVDAQALAAEIADALDDNLASAVLDALKARLEA